MDFYYVEYRKKYYSGGEWEYRSNNHSRIIVIANGHAEAATKINHCIKEIEKRDERCRVIKESNIEKAIGLCCNNECFPIQ